MSSFRHFLKIIVGQRNLEREEARLAFDAIMQGHVPEVQLAAFLTALHMRGETKQELLGAVEAVRAQMRVLPSAPEGTVDVCGTGGDGLGTLNVSTAVAFVLAGLGVPVAKHGGRALSSRSGAADVLECLGISPDGDMIRQERRLYENGLAFLAAPLHHPAMRYAAEVRKNLGFRTLFNLLGPLCNPAHVRAQLVGVFSRKWCKPVAEILAELGGERICVVHGETDEGGIDELTLAGKSYLVIWEKSSLRNVEITAEMAGLPSMPVSYLRGGAPEENASRLSCLLKGERGCYRDTVLLNAALGLHVAGRGNILSDKGICPCSLKRNIAMAAHSIDSSLAFQALLHAQEARSSSVVEASGFDTVSSISS